MKEYNFNSHCTHCPHKNDAHDMNCIECCPVSKLITVSERLEAAEEMIEAQEYFDAAVGLPECWSDKKEYERDLEKTMTRLRAAREKWGEVSK